MPTPIGNLGDITLRALEVLKSVDAIACEDTRHSKKLLMHFGINKPVERLDAHTMRERARGVLERYPRLAFVSDAGTPGLSDPGADLVDIALAMQYRVEALPGATALIPALVLSGLPTQPFAFYGFLHRGGKERRAQLETIARSPITTAIYESPHRLIDTLEDLIAVCGADRACAVVRELTKLHEETVRGTLSQTLVHFQAGAVRGEIVVVIAGETKTPEDVDYLEIARGLSAEGNGVKEIRAALQRLGADRNAAYSAALEAQKEP